MMDHPGEILRRKNPFRLWLDEEQCRGVPARDARGRSVPPCDPRARSWSARGWMAYQRLDDALIEAFVAWMREHRGDLDVLNDRYEWAPAAFCRAWDDWAASLPGEEDRDA